MSLHRRSFFCRFVTALSLLGVLAAGLNCTAARADDSSAGSREQAVTKAIDFLRSQQAADGSFSAQAGPAITGW